MIVRLAPIVAMLLAGCAAPRQAEQPKPDPTKEAGYAQAVEKLAALNQQAEDLVRGGRADDAAAAITQGQPLETMLLAAPQPTLPAMEAVSDRVDLYARMLFSNHQDGWARMLWQKNLARWKIWKPQTAESARRLRQAQEGMAECDRRIGK